MESSVCSRVTLYSVETGEARDFHPIDARLCIDRGGWAETPSETAKPAEDTKPPKGKKSAEAEQSG